jgi:hypothetical protein
LQPGIAGQLKEEYQDGYSGLVFEIEDRGNQAAIGQSVTDLSQQLKHSADFKCLRTT